MGKIILVIAAHSDDEALGCAGTILKHTSAGDIVHLLFMTNGVGAREASVDDVEKRISASENAINILNVSSVTNFNFPDNQMDTVALLDVVKAVEGKVNELSPEMVYTHWGDDLNVDHKITHDAVVIACRPYPNQPVRSLYSFEVLSSTDWASGTDKMFHPNLYVDISDFIDQKVAILECYQDEMRSPPHTRSIENTVNLAKLRGNTVGLKYAEAFRVIRVIVA